MEFINLVLLIEFLIYVFSVFAPNDDLITIRAKNMGVFKVIDFVWVFECVLARPAVVVFGLNNRHTCVIIGIVIVIVFNSTGKEIE